MTCFVLFLQEDPGYGTSDGTFRKKRYFICPPKSAVFVTLQKLHPRGIILKRGNLNHKDKTGDFKSVRQSLGEGKEERELPEERIEIDQRVVTFIDGHPARGTVRYIGKEKDESLFGLAYTVVGLELVGKLSK